MDGVGNSEKWRVGKILMTKIGARSDSEIVGPRVNVFVKISQQELARSSCRFFVCSTTCVENCCNDFV